MNADRWGGLGERDACRRGEERRGGGEGGQRKAWREEWEGRTPGRTNVALFIQDLGRYFPTSPSCFLTSLLFSCWTFLFCHHFIFAPYTILFVDISSSLRDISFVFVLIIFFLFLVLIFIVFLF